MKTLRLFATLCVAFAACQTGNDSKNANPSTQASRATQVLDDATQASQDGKQKVVDAATHAGSAARTGVQEASADMQGEAQAQYERLKRQLAGQTAELEAETESLEEVIEEAMEEPEAILEDWPAEVTEAVSETAEVIEEAIEAVETPDLEIEPRIQDIVEEDFTVATPEVADLDGESVQSRMELVRPDLSGPLVEEVESIVEESREASVAEATAPIDEISPEAEMRALEARMRELATPGREHQILNPMEGTFQAAVKLWMLPGTEAVLATGTSQNQWALGGRFLETHYAGNMMGEAYYGFGHLGYDKVRKAYVGYWVDSMGTQMMNISIGQLSADRKSITLVRTTPDAMTGKELEIKEVLTLVDQDHHSWEMWGFSPDGTYYRMVHIDYTRKQ